jgi:hypothetical protein
MTPLERADRAKEMVESPIFKAAFDDIGADLVAKLVSSPREDVAQHHEITLSLQALNSLRVQFQRYMSDAAIAKHNERQDDYMRRIRESVHGGGSRG